MPRSGALTAGDAAGSWRPWGTDCHASDRVFCKGCGVRRDTWVPPYRAFLCRGGRPCPPGVIRNIFVGQGPRALPGGCSGCRAAGWGQPALRRASNLVQVRCGSSGRPTPTNRLPIELRRGRRPDAPNAVDAEVLPRPARAARRREVRIAAPVTSVTGSQ